MLESRFLDTISTLGFRHVLADAISILRDEGEIDLERRKFVLNDLAKLFRQAAEGSAVTEEPDKFLSTANASAFKSYKYVCRYLPRANGDQISSRLFKVAKYLKKMADEKSVSTREKEALKFLFDELLRGMCAPGRVGLPDRPTTFAWKF